MTASADDLLQHLADTARALRTRPREPGPTLNHDAVAALVHRMRTQGLPISIADIQRCWDAYPPAGCAGVPAEPSAAARDARLDAHARMLVDRLLGR